MSQKTETAKEPASKRMAGLIGGLAFAIGFLLAIIGGAVARDPYSAGIVLALVILGVAVSVLNITSREVVPIMLAAVVLIVAGSLGGFAPLDDLVDGLGRLLNGIVYYLAVFMIPVGIISAVRAMIALARHGD